jgi:FAD:protein FMN transferase
MRDKKRFILSTAFILLLILLGQIFACSKPPQRFEETRSLMDTYVSVIIYSNEKTAAETINAAFARMEEIANIASIFDSKSQAFLLNQDGFLENPSADLEKMISMSQDYSKLTNGCFDITIQPVLELWAEGLWKEDESTQKVTLEDTLQRVGWNKIILKSNRIYFNVPEMKLTLGGIAKGYAVDSALQVLRGMGIEHALINAGGDMGMIGAKPGNKPWTISLENPDDKNQSIATFKLTGEAIATSGNYERYFDPEKQAHHIIDPRTGFSANECISVTIIADTCTRADILATSVFVMGPAEGMKLVDSLDGVECLLIDSDREIYTSRGLSKYMDEGIG